MLAYMPAPWILWEISLGEAPQKKSGKRLEKTMENHHLDISG